jgi:8-oxo-dGTP diphosphatase
MDKKVTYFNPSLTVDVVVFTIDNGELKVLLIKRKNEPYKGSFAIPGGFLHKGETMQEAVIRVIYDKAGVKKTYFEQLYTFDTPGRDPRGEVFSVAYFALMPKEKLVLAQGESQESPEFFSVKKLPKLAFDHQEIIKYAHARLKMKLEYTNIVYSLLGPSFTLTQLQKIYEVILEKKIDKRNFRKKYDKLGLLVDTHKILKGERARPARLFSFKTQKKEELKKSF